MLDRSSIRKHYFYEGARFSCGESISQSSSSFPSASGRRFWRCRNAVLRRSSGHAPCRLSDRLDGQGRRLQGSSRGWLLRGFGGLKHSGRCLSAWAYLNDACHSAQFQYPCGKDLTHYRKKVEIPSMTSPPGEQTLVTRGRFQYGLHSG